MAAIAVGFFQDSSRGILHCFLSYSVYNYFNKNTRERERERDLGGLKETKYMRDLKS